MPYLPAVFRKKRDHTLLRNLLSGRSNEPVEASARPSTLQVTPGGTPSWASQPWHYVFQVSTFRRLRLVTYLVNQNGDEVWALGVNGRWRLVMVIGNGFLENIEVSNVLYSLRCSNWTPTFTESETTYIQRNVDKQRRNDERDVRAWMW